jgi:hypothetical protein
MYKLVAGKRKIKVDRKHSVEGAENLIEMVSR